MLAGLAGAGPSPEVDGDLLTVHVPDEELVTAAAASLDSAGIPVSHLAVRLPSLDEAFLAITGHRVPDRRAAAEKAWARAGARR